MFRSLSELSEINPNFECPSTLNANSIVSFIPMGDVSDSGHWTTHRTKPLSSVQRGFTPFANGDVLFAKITPCMENGKGAHVTGLANNIGFGSTEFHVLRPKPGTDARFLFHHSQHQTLRLAAEAAMTGSAGQKRVPTEFFRKWKIYSPKESEQSKIAEILDTLDTQIQKTDALITKLEKIKEGLIHDLLTRGIDQNGQLRPAPEQAPELYKESALGLIPKDWAVGSVHQDFVIDSGFTLGAHRRPQRNARPYLRVANVHRGRLDLSEIAYLEANDEEMAKKSLSKDDLLIVEGHANPGEIGRCAMATESVSGYTFQNHLFRLKAIALLPHFAFLWMNSDTVKKYWRKAASSSSGLYTINRTKLEAVPTAKPKNAEQLAISRLVKKHEDEIATATQELEKVKKLKVGISDDLLTGKVRVTPLLKDAV